MSLRIRDSIYIGRAEVRASRKIVNIENERRPALAKSLFNAVLVVSVIALFVGSMVVLPVRAQTQLTTATPGYINLGMTTSVLATAPTPGAYTVVVESPTGAKSALGFTATTGGQLFNETYGNATVGFDAVVNEVGTYNVFLEQGTQVVSSTSFYTTNQLYITMDMVTGGTCAFVQGVLRGEALIPRFTIHYASDPSVTETDNTKGANVNFTMPSGQMGTTGWDPHAHIFGGYVADGWNYTYVGTWNPTAVASDAAGNVGTFEYTGTPFSISPAVLSTNITLVDTATGHIATSLSNGEGLTVLATITYPTNAEPVSGFVGPLDAKVRGGSVSAQVGWGYYNETSGTYGGGKTQGALIGTVLMTYTGVNGTWTGQFESSSLPTLPAGATFEVAVNSKDSANPPNTGFSITNVAETVTVAPTTLTQTTTVASLSTVVSTATTVSTVLSSTIQTSVQTVLSTVQSIPTTVYAALVILLVAGLVIGYIVRSPKGR